MRLLFALCFLSFALLLEATGCSDVHGQSATDPPTITIDVAKPGHEILGFGAQIWAGDMDAEPVLKGLGMRYVRMTVGPNWPEVGTFPPTDVTREVMDLFLADHFDADHQPRLENAKRSWEMTDRLGIKVIMIQFTAPDNWLSKDGQRRLLPEHLDDYARYWGSLVAFMDSHGMRPPYIELSNEPEGDWNTRIMPDDYNRLVILTRNELNHRGFQDVQIVGPGLAYLDHDDGGKHWVDALTPAGVDSISAWSTHAWDEAFQPDAPTNFINERWQDFKTAIRLKGPAGQKPIFITEYATSATTFNGVVYDAVESDGNNRASDANAFAVRVFEQTLQHINQGASVLIYWQAVDQSWLDHTWGLMKHTPDGIRPRPVFHAFKTLMPLVSTDVRALKPLRHDEQITVAGFLAKDGLIIAMANSTNTTQSRTLKIHNAPGLTLLNTTRFHEGGTEQVDMVMDRDQIAVELLGESTLTCHFQLNSVERVPRD